MINDKGKAEFQVEPHVIDALIGDRPTKRTNRGFLAFCPAHPDGETRNSPSLHVSPSNADGRVLLRCYAGCTPDEIVAAVGLKMYDLYPKGEEDDAFTRRFKKQKQEEQTPPPEPPPEPTPTPSKSTRITSRQEWEVKDEEDQVHAIHVRIEKSDGSKTFRWKLPDAEKWGLEGKSPSSLPLYGSESLPFFRQVYNHVVICEGEKATDALVGVGIPAVGTTSGSHGTPDDAVLESLRGLGVILWPDNDEGGREHMDRIGKRLIELKIPVKWFEWKDAAPKSDAADHPATQDGDEASVRGLEMRLRSTPAYAPEYDPERDGAAPLVVASPRFEAYLEQAATGQGITGMRTGFLDLDAKMGGVRKGESVVIGAMTGVGKSILASQIGIHAAVQRHKVLFISTEMSIFGYIKRWAHAMAKVPSIPGETKPLDPLDIEALREGFERLMALPIVLDDWPGNVDRIKANIEKQEPDIVIIDHLHRMRPKNEGPSKYVDIGRTSLELTNLKREYPVSVVIAAQLSRANVIRKDKRPMLTDLKDASDVEQDADQVLLLHRPGFYTDDEDKDKVEVFCRKFRDGELFNTVLWQITHQAWFTESRRESLGLSVVR